MAQILTINFCQPEQKGMLAVSDLSDCALKYHLNISLFYCCHVGDAETEVKRRNLS